MPTVVDLAARARSVRGRSTLLVASIVLAALLAGAVVLLLAFESNLQSNLDQTLELQARDRARLISEGSDPSSVVELQRDESFVWVGTTDGTPVATSSRIIPLQNPIPNRIGGIVERELSVEEIYPSGTTGVEIHEFRIAAATTDDGAFVVVAGSESELVGEAVGQLARLFLAALPVIVALVGLLTWVAVGRALAPVDAIRRKTEAVTGTELSDRVSVPATGDEIQHLAETMNSMLDRVEAHRDSLRQFTSDASHELKSPVANLRALVDTSVLDDERWPELRSRLVAETARLSDLVENLLFLAAHSETAGPRHRELVALDDLLFDAAQTLTSMGHARVSIDGVSPATVRGNLSDLRRLIHNLVDNAARHANSEVRLASTESVDSVVVTVADDGLGVPPADRDRVFERFARLDSARDRESGGTGLGLAIVKQVAADHGGTVTIGSNEGGGACFTFTLPRPSGQ